MSTLSVVQSLAVSNVAAGEMGLSPCSVADSNWQSNINAQSKLFRPCFLISHVHIILHHMTQIFGIKINILC